jgi:membrane-bound inhibitor of C-type lysozyme
VALRHSLRLWALGSSVLAPTLAAALPAEIEQVLNHRYGAPAASMRYLDASFDLNGDGRPEVIVHVVGTTACGTGGCATLVFTPRGNGYRLVAAILVSRPPIRVARASTNGWRNLVVHSGGGGVNSGDMELAFDGKRYPANPSVAGPRVQPFSGADAQVVIAETPSAAQTRAQQRLIESQIRSGRWPAPIPIAYVCEEHENDPLSVAFYSQTEPPSAQLKFGHRQTVLLAASSGSGARYVNDEVEFWEHQGDARLVWSGTTYRCKFR